MCECCKNTIHFEDVGKNDTVGQLAPSYGSPSRQAALCQLTVSTESDHIASCALRLASQAINSSAWLYKVPPYKVHSNIIFQFLEQQDYM